MNYMLNGKAMIILLTFALIKTTSLHKRSCFPELHIHNKSKVEVELELYNYATKSDFRKSQILIHISLKKCDLACLKSDIDK